MFGWKDVSQPKVLFFFNRILLNYLFVFVVFTLKAASVAFQGWTRHLLVSVLHSCLKNNKYACTLPPAPPQADRSLGGSFGALTRTFSPGFTLLSVVQQQLRLVITSIYLLPGCSDKVMPESYLKGAWPPVCRRGGAHLRPSRSPVFFSSSARFLPPPNHHHSLTSLHPSPTTPPPPCHSPSLLTSQDFHLDLQAPPPLIMLHGHWEEMCSPVKIEIGFVFLFIFFFLQPVVDSLLADKKKE